jgi:dihydroxy-acid dehydratase
MKETTESGTRELRRHSGELTGGYDHPAARAMLYGAGLTDSDMALPQVGVISAGYEGNPCNMHLNDLAANVKQGLGAARIVGLISNTIGVSDGISMGTPGMRYSLPSRDLIADSIETIASAQHYDGVVTIMGCDKNMPGAVIAMCRLNRPGLMIYGGTIRPGVYEGEELDVVSSFEALGQYLAGKISEERFHEVVRRSCPGPGACGGMYTANTMASAIEALGMSLPYSASAPAESTEKAEECGRAGEAARLLLERNLCPRDIVTRRSFDNAITTAIALGGSTNAVLHLLAIARALDLDLKIDDFEVISRRVPLLADFRPSGRYRMEDLHRVGGTPAVMKLLLEHGMLDGDCMTVTGKTLGENLEAAPSLSAGQEIVRSPDNPVSRRGHLRILHGNLARDGAVAKITGKEGEVFEGPARVFNSEADANRSIRAGEIVKGDVVVIRYEGPRGGPGMPEMLTPTSMIMGRGLGKDVALITDGRFSGGTHGFVVGHITPEAQDGGVIALVEDGDIIRIDAVENVLEVNLTPAELDLRRHVWEESRPGLRVSSGALFKYAQCVSSASEGCTTDREVKTWPGN